MAKKQRPSDPVVRELDAIKRLLILQLLKGGVPSNHIALALGVVPSAISETIPVRLLSTKKAKEE